ncbi:PilX N-terminal domain-containing pilus assembly protein [Neobacillus vireti]|uniref:PilX N-terminal domain-containing pilus assembly protein n=1 Tax=Neobacillus vireti TaxID=220686 RepID=UPI003000269B
MKKWYQFLKSKNNEQGMALVAVLMVVVVVSIMGVSMMGLTASNLKMSTGERNHQSTYYIAESGANLLMSEVTKKVQEAYTASKTREGFYALAKTKFTENNYFAEQNLSSFEKAFGEQPNANYRLQEVNAENGQYKIISKGTIDNRTRTVEQEINLRWSMAFPKTAVFVDSTITVDSGSAIINGSIGTNSTAEDAITLQDPGSIQIGAEIIVGPNAPNQGKDVVNISYSNIKVLEEKIPLDLKEFKSAPTLQYPETVRIYRGTTPIDIQVRNNNGDLPINQGNDSVSNLTISDTMLVNNAMVLNDLKIYDKNTLNINIAENKNVELYVNSLDVSGTLNIVGGGKLSIYVGGNLTFHNGVINEITANRDKLSIYLKKSTTSTPKIVTASSTPTGINCSIFAEDATFDFTGGTFRGKFVTGGAVTIGGNNIIEGAIVAESLHLKGNSTITFIENDHIALPFPAFIIDPLNPNPVRET